MIYNVTATKYFLKQIEKLSDSTKEIIKEKIEMVEKNPFRFKALNKSGLFRIRLSDQKKDLRLIYQVKKGQVIILGISERKKGYSDLRKYLTLLP